MVCDNCKNIVPDDSEYCPFCGSSVKLIENEKIITSDLQRGYSFLELKCWKKATEIFETAIVNNDNKAIAYLGRLLAKLKLSDIDDLAFCNKDLSKYDDFKMAVKYADTDLKQQLKACFQNNLENKKENDKTTNETLRKVFIVIWGLAAILLVILVLLLLISLG